MKSKIDLIKEKYKKYDSLSQDIEISLDELKLSNGNFTFSIHITTNEMVILTIKNNRKDLTQKVILNYSEMLALKSFLSDSIDIQKPIINSKNKTKVKK